MVVTLSEAAGLIAVSYNDCSFGRTQKKLPKAASKFISKVLGKRAMERLRKADLILDYSYAFWLYDHSTPVQFDSAGRSELWTWRRKGN